MRFRGTLSRLVPAALWALVVAMLAATGFAVQKPSEETPLATYQVKHDHAVGSGRGELRITASGIEYVGASEREKTHSKTWSYDDIKRIELSKRKVTVF